MSKRFAYTWRSIFAFYLAMIAIADIIASPTRPHLLMMSGGLLLAWHMAFVPGMPLRAAVRDIPQRMLAGQFRTSVLERAVAAAGLVLIAVGAWQQFTSVG
ncbi:hypothetical protein [Luteibacter yeojuensis]|nr:hypothetical protein [Luteibacter yeojuensis]